MLSPKKLRIKSAKLEAVNTPSFSKEKSLSSGKKPQLTLDKQDKWSQHEKTLTSAQSLWKRVESAKELSEIPFESMIFCLYIAGDKEIEPINYEASLNEIDSKIKHEVSESNTTEYCLEFANNSCEGTDKNTQMETEIIIK